MVTDKAREEMQKNQENPTPGFFNKVRAAGRDIVVKCKALCGYKTEDTTEGDCGFTTGDCDGK
ncbi:MAG: hypothetical protein WC415_04360 [Patescibacteria group bacterium]|jgi:hypothetical protein